MSCTSPGLNATSHVQRPNPPAALIALTHSFSASTQQQRVEKWRDEVTDLPVELRAAFTGAYIEPIPLPRMGHMNTPKKISVFHAQRDQREKRQRGGRVQLRHAEFEGSFFSRGCEQVNGAPEHTVYRAQLLQSGKLFGDICLLLTEKILLYVAQVCHDPSIEAKHLRKPSEGGNIDLDRRVCRSASLELVHKC